LPEVGGAVRESFGQREGFFRGIIGDDEGHIYIDANSCCMDVVG